MWAPELLGAPKNPLLHVMSIFGQVETNKLELPFTKEDLLKGLRKWKS